MKRLFRYILIYPYIGIIIVSGFVFHMLIVLPSGSFYCFKAACGYFFWGAHGHDSIWHLSLSELAFKKIPFETPIFAGVPLSGYNILFDLAVYGITLLRIPSRIVLFKLMPLIWFVLFTIVVLLYARKVKNDPRFVACFLFCVYFAGSFGYLLTLFHHGTLFGSESIVAMQSGHTLLNMQFAFSLIVLLCVLNVLHGMKFRLTSIATLGFLSFLAFGLKFYAGVIVLSIVGIHLFFVMIKNKKVSIALYTMGVVVISAASSVFLLYRPSSSGHSGFPFALAPFAHMHSMIEEKNLFYLKDMVNARYFLQEHGIGPRLLAIELFSLLLYVVFNMGTRIVGFIFFIRKLSAKKITIHEWSIFGGITSAIVLTTLLIQKGEWWNTVQFFYYAIFLSNIFFALCMYELWKKRTWVSHSILFLLILLTIPINVDLVKNFAQFPAPSYLPQEEIEALNFLKHQPNGKVAISLYDVSTKFMEYSDPRPLYAYSDTAYVAAFSGKPLYVSDEKQLKLLNISFETRKSRNNIWDCAFAQEVSYFYKVKDIEQTVNFISCPQKTKKIFENKKVVIWKTN